MWLKCTGECPRPVLRVSDRLSIEKCGPVVVVLCSINSFHLNREE